MRKQTKLVAVLSAAALLAIGASMTSFAAAGWKDVDGTWVYLDSDNERVTDTWKKSGNHYFYLDENGEMATNAIIDDGEDKYYVNEAGAKVSNQWVAVDNEDDETVGDNEVTTLWYYFGSTGKAYKDAVKTINGYKYIFDEDGRMLSGWQTLVDDDGSEDLYYLGDENEGWAATGWQLLEPQESDSEAYDDEEWFYFKPSTGVAYKNERKYINGFYYTFGPDGVMDTKWVLGTPGAPTSSDHAHYDAEIGYQGTGWVLAYDDKTNDDEDDQSWYYLDSKGVPFNEYGADAATSSSAIKKDNEKWDEAISGVAAKKIKGKTYLFDDQGRMKTGVYVLSDVKVEGSTLDLDGVYFFDTADGSVNGQMVTGKKTVTYDGDNYYYYFQKDGAAYTNYIADGVYYNAFGERVNAEDGNTYSVIENVPELSIKGSNDKVAAGSDVIVGSTGKIRKSGKVKIDGVQYTVDDYVITKAEAID